MSGPLRTRLGPIERAVRPSHLIRMIVAMVVAFPTPVAASNVSSDALRTVLGPSSTQILGAARVAASYGTVSSGFRTVAHNRRVGGVPTSYHLVGRAIDVERRRGVTHQMIETALQKAGFVLVESLDERDHSHFAFASAWPFSAAGTGSRVHILPATPPAKPLPPRVLADDHGVLIAASPSLAIAGQP